MILKFRIWNRNSKKMLYLDSTNEGHNHYLQIGSGGFWLYNSTSGKLMASEVDKDVIMQFSNWRDKNKKEIYDGDILNLVDEEGELITVLCRFDSIVGEMSTKKEVEIIGFYFLCRNGFESLPIVKNYQGKHDCEIMTIIGNIYENHELFEQ